MLSGRSICALARVGVFGSLGLCGSLAGAQPAGLQITNPTQGYRVLIDQGLSFQFSPIKGAQQYECAIDQGAVHWTEITSSGSNGCSLDIPASRKKFKFGQARFSVRAQLRGAWSQPATRDVMLLSDASQMTRPLPPMKPYVPVPQPVSQPVPQPMPQPVPRPMPQPMPQAVPQPMPRPVPQQVVVAQPTPQPMPAPAAPAKPGRGASKWDADGYYYQAKPNEDFVHLICPGWAGLLPRVTVKDGILSFQAQWADGPLPQYSESEHPRPRRTFAISVPILPDGPRGRIAATVRLPFGPVRNYLGDRGMIAEVHVSGDFSVLAPQGSMRAVMGTGRRGTVNVAPSDGSGAGCSVDLEGPEFQAHDPSQGNFCNQSGASCTKNSQCCSRSCSSRHGESGRCVGR